MITDDSNSYATANTDISISSVDTSDDTSIAIQLLYDDNIVGVLSYWVMSSGSDDYSYYSRAKINVSMFIEG